MRYSLTEQFETYPRPGVKQHAGWVLRVTWPSGRSRSAYYVTHRGAMAALCNHRRAA